MGALPVDDLEGSSSYLEEFLFQRAKEPTQSLKNQPIGSFRLLGDIGCEAVALAEPTQIVLADRFQTDLRELANTGNAGGAPIRFDQEAIVLEGEEQRWAGAGGR